MRNLIILLLCFITVPAIAETPEEVGFEIAKEADLRDAGFIDYKVDLVMKLRNAHNEMGIRKLSLNTLEQKEDGDKSLVVFYEPKDVNGTALLTFSHNTKADDQWLFLPALKRVKRISSKNKSGPFMGSEFAYEDIASQEVEKYKYRFIREENIDEQECFVLERFPLYEYSGYSKEVVWIDKIHYRTLKIDFYRKNKLLKTLTYGEYHQYLNKFWRPQKMFMMNHQTGKSTELIWADYHFQTGLKENDFQPRSLKRVM